MAMTTAHYDLFVIGGGSGGVAAARASAAHGAKVAIAEGDKFGGTCVNRGCMPKKWYMYASQFAQCFEAARSYGWSFGEASLNWQTLKTNTFDKIRSLNDTYASMLADAGVTAYRDMARFVDAHTVELGGRRITADRFVIAVGGKPYVPPIEGAEHGITSDDAFHLDKLPERLIIIGGGYIGVEFAGIFNGLGVETTVIYRAKELLRGFDADICAHVAGELQKKGIRLVSVTNPLTLVKRQDGSIRLCCDQGRDWHADTLMFATGRRANLDGLNLEATGVRCDERGKIVVDAWQQTNIAHIFALGDTASLHPDLTPVAINEARAFADTQFGGYKRNFDAFLTPTAVFSQPPIGTVGYSEADARARFPAIDIYRSTFRPTHYALSDTIDEELMMKLVVDRATDKVVGAHMAGPDAPEIIQALAVALRAGATKRDFDRTTAIHPTLAEEFVTMREAAQPAIAA